MPSWSEILKEINNEENRYRTLAMGVKDAIRHKYLEQLHQLTKRNVIVYYSGWLQRPDIIGTEINDEDKNGFIEALHGIDPKSGLDLILHTPGGEIGATESIVDYLRSIFGNNIRAFIPQLAMSGGTVIACACKEIYMFEHSSLGPIDPQMITPDGRQVAAHGAIEEFDRAQKEILLDPRKINAWSISLSKYDPAFIIRCEKAIERTKVMVQTWLSDGMFETEKLNVSKRKSEDIVNKLTDYKALRSHDRHLSPDFCKNNIGLNIIPIEKRPDLREAVISVHHACMLSFDGSNVYKIIQNHTRGAYIKIST